MKDSYNLNSMSQMIEYPKKVEYLKASKYLKIYECLKTSDLS